jgi:hypothetical protein
MGNENERTLGLDAEVKAADESSESAAEGQADPDEGEADESGEGEGEETLEALREKAAKAEAERDRYKTDLLAIKKSRKADANQKPQKSADADIEAKVEAVMHRKNERSVLRKVVDAKNPLYLPELVDDRQYREIVGYLPRNVDRSSEDGIHRALKLAVRSWKEDGGQPKEQKRGESPADKSADVAASASRPGAGGHQAAAKQTGMKLLRKQQGIDTWYLKK